MVSSDVGTLLASMNPPILPPELKQASVRYRCELEGGETWELVLHQGRLSLADKAGKPDCVIQSDPETLVRTLSGRAKFLPALARGDIRVQGSVTAFSYLNSFVQYAQLVETNA
jgi:putative sterol carrier protein